MSSKPLIVNYYHKSSFHLGSQGWMWWVCVCVTYMKDTAVQEVCTLFLPGQILRFTHSTLKVLQTWLFLSTFMSRRANNNAHNRAVNLTALVITTIDQTDVRMMCHGGQSAWHKNLLDWHTHFDLVNVSNSRTKCFILCDKCEIVLSRYTSPLPSLDSRSSTYAHTDFEFREKCLILSGFYGQGGCKN